VRIAIIGAGGVGGYYGARLAAAGEDVTLIARGPHLAAIRERGLTVRFGGGEETYHLKATDDPASVGTVDLVIIAVKLWGTAEAAKSALALLGPDTGVMSLQNGVDKDGEIAAIVGKEHVLGGITYIAALIDEPGIVSVNGTMARLLFGEFGNARTARITAFEAACVKAQLDAAIVPDIDRALWEKFAFLAAFSASTCLMRSEIGPIRANAGARRILTAALDEAAAVGRARGVALAADYTAERLKILDGIPPTVTSSMAGDLKRGNRLEAPWLSGAIVRMGKELGVPTPTHTLILDALSLYTNPSTG